MSELMAEGLQLMALGMGMVFLFLGLLVAIIALVSRVIQAYELKLEASASPLPTQQDDLTAVITAAVKQYRSDHPRRNG